MDPTLRRISITFGFVVPLLSGLCDGAATTFEIEIPDSLTHSLARSLKQFIEDAPDTFPTFSSLFFFLFHQRLIFQFQLSRNPQ